MTPDRYYHNDEIDDRFERLYLLRDQGKSLIVWDLGDWGDGLKPEIKLMTS